MSVFRIHGARYAALSMLSLLFTSAVAAGGESAPKLDWSAWRRIPVYHEGRVMPLDTFAREAVEMICDRTRPTLSLKDAIPFDGDESMSAAERQAWLEKQLNHPIYAKARTLFPEDKPRRFEAVELLFSWLVEPEKWDEVPFLIAEHDELRTKYLGLSTTNAEGKHLRYVSPRQVEEADALHERLAELRKQQSEAQRKGETLKLTGVDKKVSELWQAYLLYRQLLLDSRLDPTARRNFQHALEVAATTWFGLSDRLDLFRKMGGANGLPARLDAADKAMKRLGQLYGQGQIDRIEADEASRAFENAAKTIAKAFADFHARMQAQPPDLEKERLADLQATMRQLAEETDRLAAQAKGVRRAIYKSGDPLRVVPALDAEALELDRDPGDASEPWLDLESILMSPPEGPPDYPTAEITAVKRAFAALRTTYAEAADRPNDFARQMRRFADSLRDLAMAIEPLRQQLPIEHRDEEVIAYTAYPPPSFTEYEVLYNQTDPFKFSWIVNLLALVLFSLSFGRVRSLMFWAGVAVLAFGMGVAVYGFTLRIIISGWAPVTNMYETVIYVPFVVTVLAAWFLLTPILADGVRAAWRMTAFPGTWETRDSQERQEKLSKLLSARGWLVANVLMIGPRLALSGLTFYALSLADYAAGGRKIINLLPVIDVGQQLPDFNDTITWLVGLAILIPTVWYLPRVVLTAVLSPLVVPWTLLVQRHDLQKRLEAVYTRWPFAFAGTLVAFLGSFVAWYSPVLDKSFSPLQPVLRDNFWLLIHVLTIVSSYGAGALAWGLGLMALTYYLFGRYRPPVGAMATTAGVAAHGGPASTSADSSAANDSAAAEPSRSTAGYREPQACATLSGYIYKAIQVAVLLLAAGTILGGLWADVAWGRFWGWDPKEVWALISCLVYLALLHARYAGLIGHFGLVAGTVLGATAIAMSWYGVNFVLGAGLHSYGFGEGGQGYVYAVVAANWLFLAVAAARYYYETQVRRLPVVRSADRTSAVASPEMAAPVRGSR